MVVPAQSGLAMNRHVLMFMVDETEAGLVSEYSATGDRKKLSIALATAVRNDEEIQKLFLEALLNLIANPNLEVEIQKDRLL